MSGLVVHDAGGTAASLPGETLSPGDHAATTRRSFHSGDTLAIRGTIYGERLGDSLHAQASVRRQDGSPAASDIRVHMESGARNERTLTISTPLTGLSLGNYTLIAEVSHQANRRSTVVRELPFTVR